MCLSKQRRETFKVTVREKEGVSTREIEEVIERPRGRGSGDGLRDNEISGSELRERRIQGTF